MRDTLVSTGNSPAGRGHQHAVRVSAGYAASSSQQRQGGNSSRFVCSRVAVLSAMLQQSRDSRAHAGPGTAAARMPHSCVPALQTDTREQAEAASTAAACAALPSTAACTVQHAAEPCCSRHAKARPDVPYIFLHVRARPLTAHLVCSSSTHVPAQEAPNAAIPGSTCLPWARAAHPACPGKQSTTRRHSESSEQAAGMLYRREGGGSIARHRPQAYETEAVQ